MLKSPFFSVSKTRARTRTRTHARYGLLARNNQRSDAFSRITSRAELGRRLATPKLILHSLPVEFVTGAFVQVQMLTFKYVETKHWHRETPFDNRAREETFSLFSYFSCWLLACWLSPSSPASLLFLTLSACISFPPVVLVRFLVGVVVHMSVACVD